MDDNPSNWKPHEWAGVGVLSALGIALGLQKVINLFKRGTVDNARVDAEGQIIAGLRAELDRLREEFNTESEKRRAMDVLIHEQSIELTITKTVMVRLLEVLRQKRIEVPADIQADVERLLAQRR